MKKNGYDSIFKPEEKEKILLTIPEKYVQAFEQAVDSFLSGGNQGVTKKLAGAQAWNVITNDPQITDALIQFNGQLATILLQKAQESGVQEKLVHQVFVYNTLLQEGFALLLVRLIAEGAVQNLSLEGQSISVEIRIDGKKVMKSFNPKNYEHTYQSTIIAALAYRQQQEKNRDVIKQEKQIKKQRKKALEALLNEGIIVEATRVKRYKDANKIDTVDEFVFDKIAHLHIRENRESVGNILEFDLHHEGKRFRIKRHIGQHTWQAAFQEVLRFIIQTYQEIGRPLTSYEIYNLRLLDQQSYYTTNEKRSLK